MGGGRVILVKKINKKIDKKIQKKGGGESFYNLASIASGPSPELGLYFQAA